MIGQLTNSVKNAVKHWWTSLVVGILAIIVGIWCMITPDKTLVALTYLFVVVFIIGGLLEIIFAVSNRRVMYDWGWTLASGILELLLGILLLILPLPFATMVLIYLVGFWILFRSMWTIGESSQLQVLGVRGWGWLLALGILSILFSFVFLLSPAFGGMFIIVFVALALIIYGIFRIVLAFELHAIHKCITEIE